MPEGPAGGAGEPARGTLFVVATPIGNLGDLSPRALDVLRSVAVVAAEDTRITRRIWTRFDIDTRLVSFHAHSHESRLRQLLTRLEAGEDVALVSDAGTPLVSDPGGDLVAAWARAGGRVVAVPGASAVLVALVASGIPSPRWSFEGFLPRRGRERRERLARIAADDRASVLFESPGRTAATLRDLAAACGDDRQAALCRELTKRHEEIRRGALAELMVSAEERPPKGEVAIVVAGATSQAGVTVGLEEGRRRVAALVAEGMQRSAAARQVATETGLPRRELFVSHDDR